MKDRDEVSPRGQTKEARLPGDRSRLPSKRPWQALTHLGLSSLICKMEATSYPHSSRSRVCPARTCRRKSPEAPVRCHLA